MAKMAIERVELVACGMGQRLVEHHTWPYTLIETALPNILYLHHILWWKRLTALRANVSPFPLLMQGVFCCLRSSFFPPCTYVQGNACQGCFFEAAAYMCMHFRTLGCFVFSHTLGCFLHAFVSVSFSEYKSVLERLHTHAPKHTKHIHVHVHARAHLNTHSIKRHTCKRAQYEMTTVGQNHIYTV